MNTCLLTLLSSVVPIAATPSFVWTQADARGDDRGPGTYQYPSGDVYRPGSFDLRRLVVKREGDVVVFEVSLEAPIVRPEEVRLSDATSITLDNRIYVQNVDVYIDRDPSGGVTEAVPGRRVRFAAEHAWDVAVVLTPQPFVVRSALEEWTAGRGRVLVPNDVQSLHRTVRARVHLADLGGVPDPTWGFQVVVTGASWQASFDAYRRLVGSHAPNALTMKVTTISEPTAFGGGELHDFHPYVIDLLTARGQDQGQILRSFDVDGERYAVVPMIYVDEQAHERARARLPTPAPEAVPAPATPFGAGGSPLRQGLVPVVPAAPPVTPLPSTPRTSSVVASTPGPVVVTVQSVDGEIVVLDKPARPLKRFLLGSVFDRGGSYVGRVVIDQEYPSFLLATAVEGVGKISAGATVRFDPPKE